MRRISIFDRPLHKLDDDEGVPAFERLSNGCRVLFKRRSKLDSVARRRMGMGFAEMTWVVLPTNGG